ncbi:MAG: DUF6465 family protein [Oscillospiraceae bacterium]|nr:DUF6465 family protein [Oscillospiraceae bacterium]
MATEKKTAAKTTAKAETKTAAKTETKTTKTAAPKAETKTAAKKPAAKRTCAKKAETKTEMFIEFGGVQVSVDEIIANTKKANGAEPKTLKIYVKPEESKAYYVADGVEKEMDVYFV